VLVYDTGNIPSSTRRQIAELRKLTDKPVRFVVNSHWHPDHNLGNAEYHSAFPSATFIGTSATRVGILERVPNYFNQMKSFAPQDLLMRLRLSTGKMRDGSDMPANVRTMWGIVTRDYNEFMPEVLTARPLASDMVFDDSLTIFLGRRQVKIIRPGRGNTDGDAFIFVPDASVLLTGDLVTLPCPFPGTAYFSCRRTPTSTTSSNGSAAAISFGPTRSTASIAYQRCNERSRKRHSCRRARSPAHRHYFVPVLGPPFTVTIPG
jgi:cyclase